METDPFTDESFDRFLSESCVKPKWVYMAPHIWSGYWELKPINPIIKKVFRKLGKLLHNRSIFWAGLPLYWVTGIKEIYPELTSQYFDGE